MTPRNILLITTDEQRFDALGCNGNAHVLTPNLDRLAAQSIRFTNHTCSFPVCTPARVSMLTGQYTRTHGAWHVGVKAPQELRGISHWLAEDGYATGIFGKAHFEGELSGYVERLKDGESYYGFTHHDITEDRPDGKYTDWIKREHPEHLRPVLNDSHENCRPEPWPECEEGGLFEAYASDTPEQLRQTAWITDRTIGFMDSCCAERRPFFAWCSYVSPHHPWNPPREFAEKYDPAKLPLPIRVPGAHGQLRDKYCFRETMSEGEIRRMTALYYAMCSHIDHHVGRMLAWMVKRGLLDDTLIVFTSDHGDYNGQYGMIRKNARLYDCLLHVPMLIRLPDGQRGGTVHAGPTQHEDIAPTLMQWLGRDVPQGLQGISFNDVLTKGAAGAREESWFEYHMGRKQIAGVARGAWKLVHYPGEPGRVLVNLADDPDEMRNFAGKPEIAEMEQSMSRSLMSWLMNTPMYRLPKVVGW